MDDQPALEQLPEIIYIDGVLHTHFARPLVPWLAKQGPASIFDQRTPTCERGYVGKWQIKDDTLWLIGLYAWRDGKYTGVSDLFGGANEVTAVWFSGPLVVMPASSEISDGAPFRKNTLTVEAGRII